MSSSGILHSSVLMLCIYLVIIHTAFAQQQTHHQQHQEQTNLVIKKINDQPTQTQSIMDEFFSAANTISHPSGDHNGLSAIHGCNKVIGTIHPSESYKTLNTFVMNTRPDLAQTLNGTFFNLLKYGVQVKTVCASCSTIKTTSQDSKNVDYERYCGKNVYGYDEQQSGLVMIPLVVDENDESDKLVELHGTLAAFIHTRSTKINTYDVPSQLWTPDDEDGYQSVDIILCFLATAASGKVSFAPDLMGYGLSESLKSYLVRDSYVTSMLPLWKKVSSDLSAMTDCKTALGDAAFLQGYSEGGYGSVAIAEGLHRALGIEIVQVRAGGAPFSLLTTLLESIRYSKTNVNLQYWSIAILLGAAFSSTNPSVANYQTGRNFLKDEYLFTLDWLYERDITSYDIASRLAMILLTKDILGSKFVAEISNPDLISFLEGAIQAGVDDPCTASYSDYKVGVNDKFCEAFAQNDLIDVLHNVKYPVQVCHSYKDELVAFKNLPDVCRNPDYLTIELQCGNHIEAAVDCFSSDLMYFTTPQFLDYVPETKHSDIGCETCVDSPLRFKVKSTYSSNIMTRDCKWVTSKWRCGFEGVSATCQKTCETCSVCADSPLRFHQFMPNTGTNIARNCTWVADTDTKERCKIDGIKETCRKTCGACS